MSDKISKILSEAQKKMEKIWESELGISTYTTTTAKEVPTLTLEKLQEVTDNYFPTLYYGLTNYVEKGILYHCKETSLSPEFIVCNPDDLETIKSLFKWRRLVHISKYLEVR